MRSSRLPALVIGSLLVIPALALLIGGAVLGLGYLIARGDDGYVNTTIERMATDTVAITAEDIDFASDPGSPEWVIDALDADVRLQATAPGGETELFLGIGAADDVAAYLDGVAHEEVIDLTDDPDPVYRSHPGGTEIAAPTEQDFWAASSSGAGTQELNWEATAGTWSAVLMNADGSPGVIADLDVGAKAGFILPLSLIVGLIGLALTALAVSLIVFGARSAPEAPTVSPATAGETEPGAPPPGWATDLAPSPSPVTLSARLDPDLSRWLWLVKWILAIPHVLVLMVLWVLFVILTLVAAVAIIFTARYPESIFRFNVGVLRWSWRVSHYASTGGIGTDRYPPFRLEAQEGDPATLDVAYPERLSRGLVVVKWLLALPHLVIVALLAGSSVRWLALEGDRWSVDLTGGGGLLGLLALVAGFILLFTGRYPPALFDLIIGLNRWVYRTVAYVALMTDDYPPFRLDQGGAEPEPVAPTPPPPPTVDLTSPADRAPESVPSGR